ncbi:MAG: ATP-binding cassette domain-containing protein [Candidatus Nanopelagicales bacterium]
MTLPSVSESPAPDPSTTATAAQPGSSGSEASMSKPATTEAPAISIQNLDITYRTTLERKPTLKKAITRFGRNHRAVREVEAVRNVSFDLPRERVLGIVGNNGAGKSTLVRAIAGILPPTAGKITVRGRVSTLLALGVGFNQNLSGRENVMLGGLAAGYTRAEIDAKYEEIADWTELGDFLEMPMRTYSSGMYGRLAFAVAVHMDPDILLVDEALSTGDSRFKAKAMAKMQSLVDNSSTMVMVSHALATVEQMCTDAIWLDQGQLMMTGTPTDVIAAYTKANNVDLTAATTKEDI